MDRPKNLTADGTPTAQSPVPVKREYVAPALICLGTVAEMTQVNNDTATIPDRGSS